MKKLGVKIGSTDSNVQDSGGSTPITPPILSYLAGILDGEGSIMLTRQKSKSLRSPSLSVTSIDEELIEWLLTNFGGIKVKKKKYRKNHAQAWEWRLRNKLKLFDLLKNVLPYIVIERKRQKIVYLLENYDKVTQRNGKYTEEMLNKKLSFEKNFLDI